MKFLSELKRKMKEFAGVASVNYHKINIIRKSGF